MQTLTATTPPSLCLKGGHGPLTTSQTIAGFQPVTLALWEGSWSWDPVNIWTCSLHLFFFLPFLSPFLNPSGTERQGAGKGWEGKARVNTGNNANGATHNATGKLSQHRLTIRCENGALCLRVEIKKSSKRSRGQSGKDMDHLKGPFRWKLKTKHENRNLRRFVNCPKEKYAASATVSFGWELSGIKGDPWSDAALPECRNLSPQLSGP